jgi:hypothetical protein
MSQRTYKLTVLLNTGSRASKDVSVKGHKMKIIDGSYVFMDNSESWIACYPINSTIVKEIVRQVKPVSI